MNLKDLERCLEQSWDLLITDYYLPDFSAIEVFQLTSRLRPELPIIVLSEAVSEEQAADLIRMGVKDFVRRDNHARLIPVILRELRDAEQRDARLQAESALVLNQELTRQIFESSEDPMEILSLKGEIVSLSPAGRRALGIQIGLETPQMNFLDLWPDGEHLQKARLSFETAKQGGTGRFLALRKTLTGTHRWWSVIVTPILGISHRPESLLVVSRDVTEDKRRQEELAQRATALSKSLKEAEVVNRMKSTFLANISHEIRTPVGAMLGFAELLNDPNSTADERQSFMRVIRRNGDNLMRLLGELLDLSRIEAGQLELEEVEVPINVLLAEGLNVWNFQAQQRNLDFQMELDSSIEKPIQTDPARLKQILQNIVGNALKFTESGSVHLKVTSRRESGRNYLHFEVRDTGIGISPEDSDRIFESFQQADSSITRKFSGSGLGLALSRKLAQAMGGDLVLRQSEIGKGSVFEFWIESHLDKTKETWKSFVPGAGNPKFLQNRKVLVVEDTVDNQQLMRQILVKSGATVEMASNGLEALQLIPQKSFDLVLMDLQMPEMDGMSATRELRSQGYSLPIIAVSAHSLRTSVDEFLNCGFSGFLAKPFQAQDLLQIIQSSLETSSQASL